MPKEEDRLFSDDVKINKYKLEIECEKQASTYFYWAEKRAEAKNRLNEMEDKYKLIYSQEDLKIRSDTSSKQTENSIKAALETNKNILAAKEDIRDAQSELNYLDAAVYAMDHRKAELDNLVTLLVKGFYAAPNGGRREGVIESTERDIRKKLKKR